MHELRNERQLAKRNVLPRKKHHCEEDAKKSRPDPQLLFRKLLTHVLRSHLSRLVVTGRMLVQGLLRELAAASVGAVRVGGSVRAEVAVHASAVSAGGARWLIRLVRLAMPIDEQMGVFTNEKPRIRTVWIGP